MKAIKENWKLVLIVASGIVAVIFMCIFGVQGTQNKAFIGKAAISDRFSRKAFQTGKHDHFTLPSASSAAAAA